MPVNFDLPEILREPDDAAYTAAQLEPTRRRLEAAVGDVSAAPISAPMLIAAWTRIAELRLPRKAVSGPVLREIEALVTAWDAHGGSGMSGYAYSLSAAQREREADRIRALLALTESAAAHAPPAPRYQTE